MAITTGAGYLTSGQIARLLGISKWKVLHAEEAGELRSSYTMPGGGLRFMPAEVERYAEHLRLKDQLRRKRSKPSREQPGVDASIRPQSQASFHAAQAGGLRQPLVAGLERLTPTLAERRESALELLSSILTLLADSLQVGGTCIARVVDGAWKIEQFYDRVGMGLRVGGPLPYSAIYGDALSDGTLPSLIVEDVRADAGFADAAAIAKWRVGSFTAVPLAWQDGRPYGALCTFHPQARHVSSGELPLLLLAAHMVMQAMDADALRERERQATRKLERFAAIVQASEAAVTGSDLDGNIETWNPGASHLYGYRADEVLGKPVNMLAPPGHADEVERLQWQVAQGERIVRQDTVRKRKDGSLVDVSLTLSPMRDEGGAVVGVSAIAVDNTAHVQARRAGGAGTAAPGAVGIGGSHGGRGCGHGRHARRRHGLQGNPRASSTATCPMTGPRSSWSRMTTASSLQRPASHGRMPAPCPRGRLVANSPPLMLPASRAMFLKRCYSQTSRERCSGSTRPALEA